MPATADQIEAMIRAECTPLEPLTRPTVKVSERFRKSQNDPAGMRAPHAVAAFLGAAEVERWKHGTTAPFSFALAAPDGPRNYSALLTANEDDSGNLVILDAWRLYGAHPSNPTAAFAHFVATFGQEIVSGDQPNTRLLLHARDDFELVGMTPGNEITFSANFGRPGELGLVYAVDMTEYRRHVAAHRG